MQRTRIVVDSRFMLRILGARVEAQTSSTRAPHGYADPLLGEKTQTPTDAELTESARTSSYGGHHHGHRDG